MPRRRFAFGPFLLNPESGTLLRDGEPVAVGKRGVLLLEALVRQPGEVVTKADLMDAAWSGVAVEQSNLSVQIALLRKALGQLPSGGDWIATIPRIGYRFVDPSTDSGRTGALVLAKPSLAVLPFANLSNNPEQEFFAEGLAEEIITALSKVSRLLVLAGNSSFAYKDRAVDERYIAATLGVRYVLSGSVRKSGNRIRMTAQLIDSQTGVHIWRERYDRELADVFAVQDDVTQHIVKALEITLTPSELIKLSHGGTRNLEALDCFLRARAMQRGPTQNAEIFTREVGFLRQAIKYDPDYAEAYAALAIAYVMDYQNRWTAESDGQLSEARRLSDIAIEKDPDEPYAHAAAALVAMQSKDFERWALEVESALSLDSNHSLACNLRGHLHIFSGEPLSAIPHIERAMRLDPAYTQQYLHFLGIAYLVAGRYETAAALFKERILLVPETDMTRGYLAAALGHIGQTDEARRIWDELMAINPNYSFAERIGRLPFRNQADVEKITDGLRKAGLPD